MSLLVALTKNEEDIIEMYVHQIQAELQKGTPIETLKTCLAGLTAPYILEEAFDRAIKIVGNGGIYFENHKNG